MNLNNMFALNQNNHNRKHISLTQPNSIPGSIVSTECYQGSRLWNLLDNEHRNNKFKQWEPHCTCVTRDECLKKQNLCLKLMNVFYA